MLKSLTLTQKKQPLVLITFQKKPKELSALMDISEKLAELNWQRNQERNVAEITPKNGRAAIYAFSGDVYIGLDAYSLSEEKIKLLQKLKN